MTRRRSYQSRPKLIAVTLLTSMGQDDLRDLGIPGKPTDVVMRLAAMAATAVLMAWCVLPRSAGARKVRHGFLPGDTRHPARPR